VVILPVKLIKTAMAAAIRTNIIMCVFFITCLMRQN
jgi:hypothetical protein